MKVDGMPRTKSESPTVGQLFTPVIIIAIGRFECWSSSVDQWSDIRAHPKIVKRFGGWGATAGTSRRAHASKTREKRHALRRGERENVWQGQQIAPAIRR